MNINYMFLLWTLISLFCLVLELSSLGFFFFLSLSIGAGCAALSAIFDLSLIWQFINFAAATLVSFLVLKSWVKRSVEDTKHETNIYALIGKKGLVIQSISLDKKGWVNINGELWAAYTKENLELAPGTLVQVISSSGSHLIVKKSEKN